MNILLVTGIYPTGDTQYEGTTVCHYFAREWSKAGHNVRVVHSNSVIPKAIKYLGDAYNRMASKKIWSISLMPTSYKVKTYEVEGIPVLYIPICRPFPKSSYIPKYTIKNAVERIVQELRTERFSPQIIVGHWATSIIAGLKDYFPNVPNGIVVHEPFEMKNRSLLDRIDSIGFRNKGLQEDFNKRIGTRDREFICYSGVPEEYLIERKKDDIFPVSRFVFLGKLLPLKRVQDTIIALNEYFGDKNYSFDIVGDGVERQALEKLVTDLNITSKVRFRGALPRTEAQKIVADSQCMIMVSDHEAFGLVYLEAMAKGCICVATKGQGGDGIVEDGINGYLCEARNTEQLKNILRRLCSLSKDEYCSMSNAALERARSLTDSMVAQHYLKSIINA